MEFEHAAYDHHRPRSSSRVATHRCRASRTLSRICGTHHTPALSVAWHLTGGDPSAAEEVLQDAFVAAWRALPCFRDEARLDTWFYQILVRRAHNYRRSHSLRTLWCHPTEQAPTDPRGTTGTAPNVSRHILRALNQLSSRHRKSLVLVCMDGFTVREAALILPLRSGSVKSHLHRPLHDFVSNSRNETPQKATARRQE